MKVPVQIKVNGKLWEKEVDPRRSLLDFLREDLGLTGTKKGCNNGDCGSCVVLLNGLPVKSCLMLAVEADGQEVLTIEGLSDNGTLHPLQEAFIEAGAVQCGFCTPGMILAAKALLDENPAPSEEDIKEALVGHLCRCTGYASIIRAVRLAATRLAGEGVR